MLTLDFCLFAALCGWLEAVLYAQRAAESFTFNEHAGMMAQRITAVLLIPLAMVAYAWHGWLLSAEVVPMALLFPMVHDEAYNLTRLWLKFAEVGDFTDWESLQLAWKEYRYGYQSATTTARNDFSGRQRTGMAVVGTVLLLALYAIAFRLFSF